MARPGGLDTEWFRTPPSFSSNTRERSGSARAGCRAAEHRESQPQRKLGPERIFASHAMLIEDPNFPGNRDLSATDIFGRVRISRSSPVIAKALESTTGYRPRLLTFDLEKRCFRILLASPHQLKHLTDSVVCCHDLTPARRLPSIVPSHAFATGGAAVPPHAIIPGSGNPAVVVGQFCPIVSAAICDRGRQSGISPRSPQVNPEPLESAAAASARRDGRANSVTKPAETAPFHVACLAHRIPAQALFCWTEARRRRSVSHESLPDRKTDPKQEEHPGGIPDRWCAAGRTGPPGRDPHPGPGPTIHSKSTDVEEPPVLVTDVRLCLPELTCQNQMRSIQEQCFGTSRHVPWSARCWMLRSAR